MNEDAGTRQRKTAARADQSINDAANSEGTAGLGGLGLGIGLESRREKDGQVVFEKPKRESDQVESAGLTGKDKKAFILLVMLCKSICMRGYTRKILICRDIYSSSSRPVSDSGSYLAREVRPID